MRLLSALCATLALGWSAVSGCSGSAVVDGGGGSGNGSGSQSTARGATGATTASGGTTYGICDGPGQCTLTYPRCCPGCNTPSLEDLVPVANDQVDAFHKAQCPAPKPCPECAGCPNGALFAYCEGGQCKGNSLQRGGFASCTRAAECRLRWGSSCYEGCGGPSECGGLTAVNIVAESKLAQLVCDPDMPPPPPCVPTYPTDAVAECLNGYCEVVLLDAP